MKASCEGASEEIYIYVTAFFTEFILLKDQLKHCVLFTVHGHRLTEVDKLFPGTDND